MANQAFKFLHPADGYTCSQRKEWGQCNDQYMLDGAYCEATCNRCSSSPGGCEDKEVGGGECISFLSQQQHATIVRVTHNCIFICIRRWLHMLAAQGVGPVQ
eukprot:320552-Chlamydomonas_euryale.AAC.27